MSQMLDANLRKQLSQIFAALDREVGVAFFGSTEENCSYCEQTLDLLEEVTALSDKVHLKSYDVNEDAKIAERYHVDKAPGIVVGEIRGGEIVDLGVRFAGITGGHEFTSLVRSILMVSASDSGLSAETREFLRQVKTPVTFQVFVTPTCPYCPQAVVLAHQFAMENPLIEAEMVEAMEFPDLSDQYGVSGVPHTVINQGAGEIVGAVPEAQLLAKLQQVIEDEI